MPLNRDEHLMNVVTGLSLLVDDMKATIGKLESAIRKRDEEIAALRAKLMTVNAVPLQSAETSKPAAPAPGPAPVVV